jgi:hypothetical protein
VRFPRRNDLHAKTYTAPTALPQVTCTCTCTDNPVRILYAVDSDGFASLSLLNRNWYKSSQRLELYAYHLSRCPSYALSNTVITGPYRKNDLYRLKTKFAIEVRRNLFAAYIRPRRTLINLISVNANSSAAFPGGEAFRFAFSPNGQTILALSSSRVYVLDVTTENIVVRKELKTLRRPIDASITDDGSLLAVLSSKHQVNIYGLTPEGPKHLQVLALNDPPRTIALAHEGTVLAAAYDGLVEVFSLAANALSTDRRAVRSEAMDTLRFSGDGSMLVGSSQSLEEPNAVVITAPFYTENDPDLSAREIHSRMWTTQILFPQISSVCSHAELLQGHNEGDANWLFAYDHSLMSYRAVRTDDTRTGVAYFLNPPSTRRFSMPAPSTAPTASACGTLVSAGFAGVGLWLYGIPERLDISPDMGAVVERHEERVRGGVHLTTATGHVEPLLAYSPSVSGSSDEMEGLDSLAQKVDWRQSLFVKCKPVNSLEGCSSAKWVERVDKRSFGFKGKRLVAVAPGGVNAFGEELGEESMPVDGSRICLLDFDYAPSSEQDREITIEVGDNMPEILTEHAGDMAVEVALERRRTVRGNQAQSAGSGRVSLSRSQTAASPSGGNYFHSHPVPRRPSASQPSSPSEDVHSPQSPPISANLQRAATSGGYRAARFPPRPPLGQESPVGPPPGPGRRPSEDSWETPPPPYSGSGQGNGQNGLSNTSQSAWGPNMHGAPQGFGLQQMLPPSLRAGPAPAGINAGYGSSSNLLQPRGRGQHLATVSEGAVQYGLPVPAQPPFAEISPVNTRSPVISPSGVSPESERPVMSATINQPMSPSPELPPSAVTPTIHVQPRTDSPGLTLTGANLQNRLNHPVPPAPSGHEQRRSFSAPVQQQPLQQQLPISNVQPQSPQIPYQHHANNGGIPQSPSFVTHHQAYGQPSFAPPNGLAHARPTSRTSSGGASIPTSNSTPNLHAPGRPKYGRLDTIDSLDGSGGGGGGSGTAAAAHQGGQQQQQQARYYGAGAGTGPDHHMRMRSHSVTEQHVYGQQYQQQPGLVMYNEASQARHQNQNRVGTDPGVFGHSSSSQQASSGLGLGMGLSTLEFGKRRKGREKEKAARKARSEGWSVATDVGSGSGLGGDADGGGSGGGGQTAGMAGKKRGGSKCVVM